MKQITLVLAAALLVVAMSAGSAADKSDAQPTHEVSAQSNQAASTTPRLTGEQIPHQTVSSGGRAGNSTSFTLSGTVGQTASGIGASTSYSLTHGYWGNLSGGGTGCCIGTVGDIKLEPDCDPADQAVDISDVTNVIDHLFISYAVLCCEIEADIAPAITGDAPDGSVDVADLTAIIDHLFISYPAMPVCP